MYMWAMTVLREPRMSPEELRDLDRRTDVAGKRYGWADLTGEPSTRGEHEVTRNLAYLMMHRELSFKGATFEYLASLEKGCRKVALDSELDSAAADFLSTTDACGGVPTVIGISTFDVDDHSRPGVRSTTSRG